MTKTKIEWATDVWNPTVGCTKVSQGCKNCYAERMFNRFHPEKRFTDVELFPLKLDLPLHWKKPRRIFVDSMSDLFHKDVPIQFIEKVFAICRIAEEHNFIILTKRPERMFELLNSFSFWVLVSSWVAVYSENGPKVIATPDNVWLGVSVEDQKTADVRIPLLLQVPAAVRFVSVEPMLGKIDLSTWMNRCSYYCDHGDMYPEGHRPERSFIDWVICGGESGPGARPMQLEWAESLLDQCLAANVPFFFKQWGEYYPAQRVINGKQVTEMIRVGKKLSGRILLGRTWDGYPGVNSEA
jgi:protein gp37